MTTEIFLPMAGHFKGVDHSLTSDESMFYVLFLLIHIFYAIDTCKILRKSVKWQAVILK